MSDPYDEVPKPIGSLMVGPVSIGCIMFLIPVVALLIAIVVFRWPWWADVATPIGAFVLLGASARLHEDQQRNGWIRRQPGVMRKATVVVPRLPKRNLPRHAGAYRLTSVVRHRGTTS
jgi:hypothetical protein